MNLMQKFIPGNNINNALYKAIYSSDLEKVNSIVDSVGLSHCTSWGKGHDLLLTAIECKHLDVAKLLINKGCNLEGAQTGISGAPKSIIHLAVRQGNEELVIVLLEQDPNLLTKIELGDSILHVAIAEGHKDIVKLILSRQGIDVECRSGGGITPLHLATLRGHFDILDQLLAAKANLESKDSNGKTSLFLAVSSGNRPVVKRLLELGANCKCRSKNGQTPLLDATNKGYAGIVKDLLSFGADLNDKNTYGQTSLHIACMQKNKGLICTLLDAGADVNAVDFSGMVPFDGIAKKVSTEHGVFSLSGANTCLCYIMVKHFIKLKIGGLYLNKKNQTFYDKFFKIYGNAILMGNAVVSSPSDMLCSVMEMCEKEILLMKNTKSNVGFTVFDIFEKLKNPLCVVSKNEVEFLMSVNLEVNFNIYEDVIKYFLKNSKMRSDLISSSFEWLSFIICISGNKLPNVPEEVKIQILSNLTNEELKQFIEAAEEFNT